MNWWKDKPPSQLSRRIKRDKGRGLSAALPDRAFWLDLDPKTEQWVAALAALDQRDDAKPLLALLPPGAAPHYRDLFERKRLVARKRGTPLTPSYDRTAAEGLLELGVARVHELVRRGALIADAIERAAKQYKIPRDILDNARRSARGRTRAMKKRRD
jgi:hypothetical protein